MDQQVHGPENRGDQNKHNQLPQAMDRGLCACTT